MAAKTKVYRKRAPRTFRHAELVDFCNRALTRVMLEHDISNNQLAELAEIDPSRISTLRNGVVSLQNYVIIIRALPPQARKEYLDLVFFSPIPKRRNHSSEQQTN
jgi:hypothetical protein